MALRVFDKMLRPTLLASAAGADAAGAPPRPDGPLDAAALGQACSVLKVVSPAGQPDWERWLAEIGFLPGEQVTVTARGAWGGDPLVVRIGDSTFALRRAEAACVRVRSL